MSGGSGTRLWPVSTSKRPKQFHALSTNKTMIQETALRFKSEIFGQPVIICGATHLAHVTSQLDEISMPPNKIVLEPEAKNTAAVAAIASLIVDQTDEDALVLLLPADHIVNKNDKFVEAIKSASLAAMENIVTFGIKPTKAETGFGYIEAGEELDQGVKKVSKFCEKPNSDLADQYFKGGKHFWNGGIFLFSPKTMLEELSTFAKDVLDASKLSLKKAKIEGNVISLDAQEFAKSPSISVDYAIMENTKKAATIPCDIGWFDVGSFSEIWNLGAKDENGNHQNGKSVIINGSNNLAITQTAPIAIVGLDNIMVIATDEGILVCPINRSQDVKLAHQALNKLN